MKKTAFIAATAALATFSAGASAAYVSQVNSLSGGFAISGFNDGTPNTYRINLTGLSGSGVVNVGPSGNYEISAGPGTLGGSASVELTIPVLGSRTFTTSSFTSLFTGEVNLNGLAEGSYPFAFGTGAVTTPIGVNFGGSYDGATTMGILGFLNSLLGTSFVDPSGAGTFSVEGTITDTEVVLDVTETAVGWPGAGELLLDFIGNVPAIGGSFRIDNLAITATPTSTQVPEPASLALLGLGMAGLAAIRRRKQTA